MRPARRPKPKPRSVRPQRRSNDPVRSRASSPEITWIRALASPYLRGYRASRVAGGPLLGYRFVFPRKSGAGSRAGFFVGYLLDTRGHEFLNPAPPECIVYAFLESVGSAYHEGMVAREGSLLRKTAEYIGWLTHRPPRFAFFADREITLARHFSMREWPAEKHAHYSRNFFIETLAWLVRSGLVAKLGARGAAPGRDRL